MTSVAALYAPPNVVLPAPPPIEDWYTYFDQHRDHTMSAQVYEWTCSVCSTTWALQATGLNPMANRVGTALEIGYPGCVNPAVGLQDTQCVVDTFGDYGVVAHQEWVDWDRAYQLCSESAGVINSTRWYHFVGIRGVRNGNLWVANSAPGYQGVWDDVTPGQFNAWAGSWQIVWIEH